MRSAAWAAAGAAGLVVSALAAVPAQADTAFPVSHPPKATALAKRDLVASPAAPTRGSRFELTGRLPGHGKRSATVQRRVHGHWRNISSERHRSSAGGVVSALPRMTWKTAVLRFHAPGHGGRSAVSTHSVTVRHLPLTGRPWSGTLTLDYRAVRTGEDPATVHDVATVDLQPRFDDPGSLSGKWIQAAVASGSVDRRFGDADDFCTSRATGSFSGVPWRFGLHVVPGGAQAQDYAEGYLFGAGQDPVMAPGIPYAEDCQGGQHLDSTVDLTDVTIWDDATAQRDEALCVRALRKGMVATWQAVPRAHVTRTSGSRTMDTDDGNVTETCSVTWDLQRS